MDGRESPLVFENFVARDYEFTVNDLELYGHETIFELSGAIDWIRQHRMPRQGVLDIQLTADSLGIPVTIDKEKNDHALGTTYGLPNTEVPNHEPLEITLHPDRSYEHAVTFGHEIGHVFLSLELNVVQGAYSRVVEDFCDRFGLFFAIAPEEIQKVGTDVNEESLLQLYETYGVSMRDLIYEFVRKGFLPERMYVDSVIEGGRNDGNTYRDTICMPCRQDFGSCKGLPAPEKVLRFPDRAFGGHFPDCASERIGASDPYPEHTGSIINDDSWWEEPFLIMKTSRDDIVQRFAMKALIVHDGKILILREASTYDEGTNGGKYQLPGGRVEKGEHFETALQREVKEETGLDVAIDHPVYVGEWQPVIKGVSHQIFGVFMACTSKDTEVKLSTEHDDYMWVDPASHKMYNILSPDYLAIDQYAKNQN